MFKEEMNTVILFFTILKTSTFFAYFLVLVNICELLERQLGNSQIKVWFQHIIKQQILLRLRHLPWFLGWSIKESIIPGFLV